jgi:hypothetical protein
MKPLLSPLENLIILYLRVVSFATPSAIIKFHTHITDYDADTIGKAVGKLIDYKILQINGGTKLTLKEDYETTY